MLADLETRLAELLGTTLVPPLAGRTGTASAPVAGAGPFVTVAVTAAEPIADAFHAVRPEQPRALAGARRVARLRCTVMLSVVAGSRAARVGAVDQLLYLFSRPDLLTGRALDEVQNGAAVDRGFRLDALVPGAAVLPVEDAPATVTLEARGLFWPVGIAGETGVAIEEVRLRASTLPVTLADPLPRLVAGGPATPLRLAVGLAGTTVLRGGTAPATAAFERLFARLVSDAGGPGAGTLGGGKAAPDGARLLAPADGIAKLAYTPPAAAARDTLVVAMAEGNAAGVELARFALPTVAA